MVRNPKITNKKKSENINSWERLIHPDDKLKTLAAVREHIAGETPLYQVEYRTQTGTGKYIWVFDTGKVTEYDRAGSPSRMVGTSIDITIKKENELILQQNYIQQELLSEIALSLNSLDEFETRIDTVLQKVGRHLNVSRVYIFEDNNEGTTTSNTFEWCNENITPQIDELQDIPYEEAILSWKKILNNEGRIYLENIKELPKDLVKIPELQEIKSVLVYPLRVKGKFFGFIGFDECIQSKHWLKSELELLRTISGIIANAYERKISEESLKDSELANRAIIAALPDMLFHFNKEGRLLNYNFLQSHITVFSEVRINKSIQRIFPKHLSKKLLYAIEKCIEDEQYNFEFELPLENNHIFFEARASKINNEQVLVLMRDITKSKQYESKLTVEKNKAEQANQAKSEFLANMSHEIRTPMNAILGFSEALYNKIIHPQHKETLQSIVNSGNLLLSLLNDILDLSKIEAGKLEITPQPVDLANLLNEIIILFSAKAEKKELNLELNIDSDFPSTIVIDEIRTKQIIFNIVGNAIKFTKNGYVKIDTRFEHFKNNKGELIIIVEDSGIGISKSQQERIFDAFIQQSGQSNREFEGVGLGLAICKRLIEKMDGSITVSSTVGKGSVFKISIPNTAVLEGAVTTQKTSEEDLVFNDATVLVVDDVISNIQMMKYLLSSWGLKFLSAENGAEAIEILKTKTPDAILLDIRMPVMDGFEVAEHVKNNPSTKSIPVIACTANISNNLKNNYTRNFDGLIFKPIKPKELKEILKKNLEYRVVPKQQRKRKNKTPDLNNIKPEMLAKLPEIATILNKDFLPKWEKISGSLILFQIEDFANELKQAMQPFKCGFINAYTNEIFDDIGNIRLESLKNNLKKFPMIIEQIKNKIDS